MGEINDIDTLTNRYTEKRDKNHRVSVDFVIQFTDSQFKN